MKKTMRDELKEKLQELSEKSSGFGASYSMTIGYIIDDIERIVGITDDSWMGVPWTEFLTCEQESEVIDGRKAIAKLKELKGAICVWNYDHLPQLIKEWMEKERVANDDLDWIAMVPPYYKDRWINWLEEPVFGCCSVETYAFDEEHNLVFGYHA